LIPSDRNIDLNDPGGNRVLVVDDDLSQRMTLVRFLRKGNYESSVAMSTEEARAQLESSDFALVITDLRMFAQDGIELVRYVYDRHPSTYSIVVSGFVSEKDRDYVRRAGGFDLLTKPVTEAQVLEMVQRALHHRSENVAGIRSG
jgi:two-component system response regulator PilR (NtrC family)